MAGRDGVQDEVEAARLRLHLILVARDDDFIRTQRERVLTLLVRRGERNHMRAHRMRDLHAHVAEAADADDADLLARADVPVPQRRVGGDAGAQQRRHCRELLHRMADLQHELLIDHDPLRIAAQGMPGRVRRGAVVGADETVLAVLLQAFVAGRAMLAAAHHAADADHVADLVRTYVAADGRDATNDFMPWHAGK